MKRVIYSMVLAIVVLLTTTSCSSYGLTGQAAPLAYTDIKPDQIKVNFDFNLKQKRVGEAKATYFLGLIKLSGDNKYSDVKGINIQNGNSGLLGGLLSFGKSFSKSEKVKSAAVYNAIKDSDVDIIINPQFETQTTPILFGLFKTYKVKVKAYDGKIKDIYQEKLETKGYDIILKKE
jgi:hypothetical protein